MKVQERWVDGSPILVVECKLRRVRGRSAGETAIRLIRYPRERLRTDTSSISSIGIPARIIQLQPDVHDRLVVCETTAHDPVPGHEASQVAAYVSGEPVVVLVSEIDMVADSGGAQKSVDGRIDGGEPGVSERIVFGVGKACVFDQILEVGV